MEAINQGEGHQETEHHDEKKSVLKKVKAKAKKIKDTVAGHHGNHDHDHDHDDDEMETEHEVHAGHSFVPGLDQEVARLKGTDTASERTTATLPTSKPAYFETFDPAAPGRPMAMSEPGDYQTLDPSRARHVPGQGDILGHSRTDTGRPMPPSKPGDYQTFDPSTTRYVPGQEDILGHSRTDTGRHMRSEERPYAPRNTPVGAHSGLGHGSVGLGVEQRGISEEIGGVLERPSDLEEDPHAPKGVLKAFAPHKYQAKVTDPTGKGSEEIGVTPILHRLDRMHICDESGGEQQQKHTTGREESLFKPSLDDETEPSTDKKLFTGTHDQFSPEPITPETSTLLETRESEPQSLNTTRSASSESLDKHSQQKEGSYTEKVSSAASMVADKAKQATAIVTSKLSEYSGGAQEGSVSHKVAAMLQENVGPVLEKVAEMGSTVASKVESGPRTEPELEQVKMPVDKGVSMKEYLAEKLKPSEEDRALSELITESLPLHKQREDPNEMGHEDGGSGEASPGRGVLDKIKDAASSLFGKGDETKALSEGSKNDTSASGY
ncbi:hypothetical protein Cgig2_010596 [Carnegiea gigantea]|uniref:Low-temperature-induced 65 kDa protein-like n=1 Tax=Carnegiea gigantea TaxID=171969 RepID=A0A9Q1QNU9_9CARY|nr:hypothetical protein Cgig2_010596 [Carnegiea gigantea]